MTEVILGLNSPVTAAEAVARAALAMYNSHERICFIRAFERTWNEGDPDVEVRLINYAT